MSGANTYRDRLSRARLFWSAFMGAIWGAYTLAAGWNTDVTIVLSVVWLLAFPRNMAKRLARRAQRMRDFHDAIDDEMPDR